MAVNDLLDRFEALKNRRRTDPENVLLALGDFSRTALSILNESTISHPIAWEGAGQKSYKVFTDGSDISHWSRAVNVDLFLEDPDRFNSAYRNLADRVIADRGSLQVEGLTVADINIPLYTAVM